MISLGLSHAEASDRPQPPVEVIRTLGEAAAWCTLHPLGTNKLRSSLLDPHSSLSVPTLNELGIDAASEFEIDGPFINRRPTIDEDRALLGGDGDVSGALAE